jgi:hypothetical protein
MIDPPCHKIDSATRVKSPEKRLLKAATSGNEEAAMAT